MSETKGGQGDGERFVPDDPDYNPDDRGFARIHCRVDREAKESRT